MNVCKFPGCERIARGQGYYCSQECKFLARQQRKEHEHDRAMFEAARNAGRAETCRGCEGGFYSTDEADFVRCGCGRNLEAAA